MTLTLQTTTHANRCAEENWQSNLRALRHAQPQLIGAIETLDGPAVEWVLGRDRSITARGSDGQWLGGCSLPRLAARQMLRRLDVAGAVGCLLSPTHAAQIAVALERMRPEQALVALVPETADLIIMLRCERFAEAINAHRLWFVAGDSWPEQLEELYAAQIGLAPPAQFIRIAATAGEVIERLIARAQGIISDITNRRAVDVQALRSRAWAKPQVMRLCVVASTRFRLWNDVGHALIAAAEDASGSGDFSFTLYDADDPTCSSPLALATIARQCSALLTANTARCDLPGLLPDEMPWITWVTGARIPSFSTAAKNDRLLLADPAALPRAKKLGWPEAHIGIATYPAAGDATNSENRPTAPALSIIADTASVDVPDHLNEYSSHIVLWNHVKEELLRDPFSLGDDVQRYFKSRMQRLDIAPETCDLPDFVNRLIIPAFQQGLARMLINAKLPMELHGNGWQQIPSFAPHAHGPVESRQHLSSILASCRALVHVWPTRQAHPMESVGLPVLRASAARPHEFLAAARLLVGGVPSAGAVPTGTPLSGKTLQNILCCA